jgi:hypothetical protein
MLTIYEFWRLNMVHVCFDRSLITKDLITLNEPFFNVYVSAKDIDAYG